MTNSRINVDGAVLARVLVEHGMTDDAAAGVLDRLASQRRRSAWPVRLMYVGGLVALVAVTVLLGEGWRSHGSVVGLAGSIAVCAILGTLAILLARRGWEVPAGLAATVALGLVPLVVFALNDVTGWAGSGPFLEYHDFYVWVGSQWFWMEVATAVATAVALWRLRLPLIIVPAVVCAWFASMDAAELLWSEPTDGQRTLCFAMTGLALLAAGFLSDHVGHRHHATWLHIGALLTLSGVGVALPWRLWALGLGGLTAIGIGVAAGRATYLAFGGLWTFGVGCHLAFTTFGGSVGFPLSLLVGGGLIVAVAMRFSRTSPYPDTARSVREGLETAHLGGSALPRGEST